MYHLMWTSVTTLCMQQLSYSCCQVSLPCLLQEYIHNRRNSVLNVVIIFIGFVCGKSHVWNVNYLMTISGCILKLILNITVYGPNIGIISIPNMCDFVHTSQRRALALQYSLPSIMYIIMNVGQNVQCSCHVPKKNINVQTLLCQESSTIPWLDTMYPVFIVSSQGIDTMYPVFILEIVMLV